MQPENVVSAKRLERERKARLEAEAIAERITAELYSANQQLQNLNQTMRDFVATASHDLRSPIATILGCASTIKERWETITESQRDDLMGAIDRSAQSLSRLVDDLLTVSRIDAGALDVYPKVIETSETVEQMVKDFENASDIKLCTPGEQLEVYADPDHFRRILTNYIENARKYGAPPVEVTVARSNGWAEIKVCDHGGGVPAEFEARLFARFARGHIKATGEAKGIGLGLSIVQGLARANGGEAWYEANEPRGSCFAVRLPLKSGEA